MRINEEIRIPEVRLIDPEGEFIGIKPLAEAMKMAEDMDLDLVEISPTAKQPVCRVMDFSKFKYEKDKKEKEARKKQKVSQVKEVRFRPLIGDHDYQIKIERAIIITRSRSNTRGSFWRKATKSVSVCSSAVARWCSKKKAWQTCSRRSRKTLRMSQK